MGEAPQPHNPPGKTPGFPSKFSFRLLAQTMSISSLQVATLDPSIEEAAKKIRFNKDKRSHAVIIKIKSKDRAVIIDQELEDVTMEDIVEELPEHQPRFIMFTFPFAHGDDRVSYPLAFIYVAPENAKLDLQMMYSGSLNEVAALLHTGKQYQVRHVDELSTPWLIKEMGLK